ncbi:MAG TPA: hypothetical protein VJI52_02850 [Candidatus Nanoarchaeia archaeon]|nr:hypothetical protein [Candidatus Nanoarchaeia archaeon]
MQPVLEARIENFSNKLAVRRELEVYCDYALYIYLANCEPSKFKKTALFIDEPEKYDEVLSLYGERLAKLPLKTRNAVYYRLRAISNMYSRFGLFEGMKDYHLAAIYLDREFVLRVNNLFVEVKTHPVNNSISVLASVRL